MAFKDRLHQAIESKGGRTQENISRISGLARQIFRIKTLSYEDLYAMFNEFLLLSYESEGEELTY